MDKVIRRLSSATATTGSVVLILVARPAAAHVKWFCGAVDVTRPPVPLATVLSPLFLVTLCGFLSLILFGSFVDAVIVFLHRSAGYGRFRGLPISGDRLEDILIRLAIGLYCIFLWNHNAVAPWGSGGTILTPELFSNFPLLGLWQVLVALLLAHRRSCGLAGIGLLALYGFGIIRYGMFRMTDYAYFVGIAAYLILVTQGVPRRHWAIPALCLSLSFSLMWTAIEKFLYPGWTAIVLVQHPAITLGQPITLVTVIAGFVEFSLAFYLAIGCGLLRIGSALLLLIFLAAIPAFGNLDAVGHLPILAILLVTCLHGPSHWHVRLRSMLNRYAMPIGTAASGVIYLAALAVMTGSYYGLQRTTSWPLLAGH